jgi:uncharacterized membrane protein
MQTNKLQNFLRILLGCGMVFAAFAHFFFNRLDFQAQVPNWLPLNKDVVVILSGFVELALGLGMIFLSRQKVIVGLALGIFLILVYPGNIAQFVDRRDAFGLNTDKARFIRLLFQPILILWAIWSTGALYWCLAKVGRNRPRG